jgi:hypothetical protein
MIPILKNQKKRKIIKPYQAILLQIATSN